MRYLSTDQVPKCLSALKEHPFYSQGHLYRCFCAAITVLNTCPLFSLMSSQPPSAPVTGEEPTAEEG